VPFCLDLEPFAEKAVLGMMSDDAEVYTICHTIASDLQKCMAEDVAEERFLQDVKSTHALHRMKEFETSWLALGDNLDDRFGQRGFRHHIAFLESHIVPAAGGLAEL